MKSYRRSIKVELSVMLLFAGNLPAIAEGLVLPAGWRVPTSSELNELDEVGAIKIRTNASLWKAILIATGSLSGLVTDNEESPLGIIGLFIQGRSYAQDIQIV